MAHTAKSRETPAVPLKARRGAAGAKRRRRRGETPRNCPIAAQSARCGRTCCLRWFSWGGSASSSSTGSWAHARSGQMIPCSVRPHGRFEELRPLPLPYQLVCGGLGRDAENLGRSAAVVVVIATSMAELHQRFLRRAGFDFGRAPSVVHTIMDQVPHRLSSGKPPNLVTQQYAKSARKMGSFLSKPYNLPSAGAKKNSRAFGFVPLIQQAETSLSGLPRGGIMANARRKAP